MADGTGIEWTDATWNPVHGCSKVSPGCAHCYAEALSLRFGHTSRPWTPANADINVQLKPARLGQPLSWRRPRMVFVNSMSDLFHEKVPTEYIERVFGVMAAASQHTFQVLTKRPERMREVLTRPSFDANVARASGLTGLRFPLPNVWLGVSIENRRYVDRADMLRAAPAAVRFISAEPLLGPLIPELLYDDGVRAGRLWADEYGGPALDLDCIDWLIVGGESGPKHRAIREEWARGLRDACTDSGTAFFLKQWGGARPGGDALLDGIAHRAFPTVVAA